MNRVIQTPSAWLVFLIAVFLAWCVLAGKFQLEPYSEGDDAAVYVAMSEGSFLDFWRAPDQRNYSWGYPLLLRLVRPASPALEALPVWQAAWHVLAVVLFWVGMRQVSASQWLVLTVSGAVLFSNPGLLYNSGVHSDGPASAFAVATVGLMLILVARPANVLAWLGLALSLFLTYQIRSAYLFLIGLVPLLGVLLAALVHSHADWVRMRWRLALGLLAVAALPFAGYAAASWAAIGELGLPVMGTLNLFGITSSYLTEGDVPKLPEDVRPVVVRFLEKRKQAEESLGLTFPLTDPSLLMTTSPLVPRAPQPGADAQPPSAVLQDPLWTNPTAFWEDRGPVLTMRGTLRGIREELIRMNLMMTLLGESAREVLAESGMEDFDRPQAKVLSLAMTAIKAQPGAYAGRLVRMLFLGVVAILMNSYVLNLLYAVVLLLAGLRCARVVLRRIRPVPALTETVAVPTYEREFAILFLIAAGFALANLLLVVPITVPIFRYTDAAGVFVPAVAVVGLFRMWQTLKQT